MNKQNHKFHSKQLNRLAWAIYVTNKDGITFGTDIQSMRQPIDDEIWNLFKSKEGFKNHWYIYNINEKKLLEDKK